MKQFIKHTDQELIRLYIEGNTVAFECLIERHKVKLFTSIFLLIKDKYLAEDIFQETFIRIIDTITNKKYADEGKFLPWAMRIAHNLCIDHFRKVKRTPQIKTSDNQDIFEVISFSEPSADHKMITYQTSEKVNKMLDRLPQDQKEVIVMRHYADMSFKEIAFVTNCSINTALGRMRYGLINLRKMMNENKIAFSVMGISFYTLI
ncbi:sigma-70 family RNA polymerase sigma factor [soil metagenome]